MNVAIGCPNPYGPSAVTFTLPAVAGSVSVTDATPELFVTAITCVPLVVPFDSKPALLENKMLAPASDPPDEPAAKVTVNGFASALPAFPDWPLPVVVNVAAGLPTTIQPP